MLSYLIVGDTVSGDYEFAAELYCGAVMLGRIGYGKDKKIQLTLSPDKPVGDLEIDPDEFIKLISEAKDAIID